MSNRAKQILQLRRPNITSGPKVEKVPIIGGSLYLWKYWKESDFKSHNTAFGTNLVIRLSGKINIRDIQNSLNDIVRRHDILRMRVAEYNGNPYYVPDDGFSPEIKLIEIPRSRFLCFGRGSLDKSIRSAIAQSVMEPFEFDMENFVSEHLMRAYLIRVSDHENVLVCTFHHIITDFMSIENIANELDRFYLNRSGSYPRLPRPPVQYQDHVLSMLEWLQTDAGVSAVKYWEDKLKLDKPFRVAKDQDISELADTKYHKCERFLQGSHALRLDEFSKSKKYSLFTILMVVQASVIFKMGGGTDALIKLVHNGRDQKILFDQVGCYASFFPMRLDLSGEPTFFNLLDQVRKSWVQYISCTPCYPVDLLDDESVTTSPYINFIDLSTQHQLNEEVPQDLPSNHQREEPLDEPSRRRLLEGEGVASAFYKTNEGLRIVASFPQRFYRKETVDEYANNIYALINVAIESPHLTLNQLLSQVSNINDSDSGYLLGGNIKGSSTDLSRNILPW